MSFIAIPLFFVYVGKLARVGEKFSRVLRLINWLKALNVARKLTLIFCFESDTANWHMIDSAMNVQKESKFLLYLAARG